MAVSVVVSFRVSVDVAGETEPVHTSPPGHGSSGGGGGGGGVWPPDHSRAEHRRRRPGGQDGAQPAPPRPQADDLEHAERRVRARTLRGGRITVGKEVVVSRTGDSVKAYLNSHHIFFFFIFSLMFFSQVGILRTLFSTWDMGTCPPHFFLQVHFLTQVSHGFLSLSSLISPEQIKCFFLNLFNPRVMANVCGPTGIPADITQG